MTLSWLIQQLFILQLTQGIQKTTLLDEVDDGGTVSTCSAINCFQFHSPSTQGSTIYDLTINRASLSSYTFVESTIGSHHTAEKEESKEGGRYNTTIRFY